MEVNVSNLLLDHVKRNKIIIDEATEDDRAIVRPNGIVTNSKNAIRLVEGVIGMVGIKDLKEEIVLLQTYLKRMKDLGIDDASIEIIPYSLDEVEVCIKSDIFGCKCILINTVEHDRCANEVNSFLSQCCEEIKNAQGKI